jgi:hypothetical protein
MLVDMSSVAACMVVSLPSLIDRLPINRVHSEQIVTLLVMMQSVSLSGELQAVRPKPNYQKDLYPFTVKIRLSLRKYNSE